MISTYTKITSARMWIAADFPTPMVFKFILLGLALMSTHILGFAQDEGLTALKTKLVTQKQDVLKEKFFIQTDKQVYLTGEILWLKTLVVDASAHTPLDISKIGYVELLDNGHKSFLNGKIELTNGKGAGSFYLPQTIPSGNYLLRGYTNWMKNFSADYFFEKQLTIINPNAPPVALVNSDISPNGILLDFFPEGGTLIKGVESRIAFKATTIPGDPIEFSGFLLDQNKDTVARFTPQAGGLGSFSFIPASNKTYTAVIREVKGSTSSHAFPAIATEGYSIRLDPAGEKIKVRVSGILQPNSPQLPIAFLAVHSQKEVVAVLAGNIGKGFSEFTIDNSALREGINKFTVFDDRRRPVAERIYFKAPKQQLAISAATNQIQYSLREKGTFEFSIEGMAADDSADVSVSIHRASPGPNSHTPSLYSHLWMMSELNGLTTASIEDFSGRSDRDQIFDLLMLTYGWRQFNPSPETTTSTPPAIRFLPEMEGHIVEGSVTDKATGMAARDIMTFASIPSSKIQFYVSSSDSLGKIRFLLKDFYGEGEMIVQTDPIFEDKYNVNIRSPFHNEYSSRKVLPLMLNESWEPFLNSQSLAVQVQNVFASDRLRTYNPMEVDSTAFFLNPDASYMLDNFKRFTTMEEVLREYVPGVTIRRRDGDWRVEMVSILNKEIFYKPLVLLDGVPVFRDEEIIEYDPMKVKRLDVVLRKYYYGPAVFHGIASFNTYNGDLAGYTPDPRSVVIDFEGLQNQRKYFSPQYLSLAERELRLPDYRTQLLWEPGLVSKSGGKNSLSFFTSDQPGIYKVEVTALSSKGVAGKLVATFEVK